MHVYAVDFVSSGTCGSNVSWNLDTDGTLKVFGEGKMDDYSNANYPWKTYKDDIDTVYIQQGIQNIGSNAFEGCTNIKEIHIGQSVEKVGDAAFYQCKSLMKIEFSDALLVIGKSAFGQCGSLKEIEIPSSVKTIGQDAFIDCTVLSNVILHEGLMEIQSGAFRYCKSLKKVDLPDTISTLGASAFYGTVIEQITVPINLTTCGYQSGSYNGFNGGLDGVFSGCQNLKKVIFPMGIEEIPDGILANSMGNVPITEIIIPDSVKKIGKYAFLGLDYLENIELPEQLAYIGDSAFYYCRKLKYIDIPKYVNYIGSECFRYCDQINVYNVDPFNNQYCSLDGVLYSKDLTKLIRFPSARTGIFYVDDKVIDIAAYAFSGCSLSMVSVSDSVKSIGDAAFTGSSVLSQVVLGEGITQINSFSFSNCISLKQIFLANKVNIIKACAFDGSNELEFVYYAGEEEQWNTITIGTDNTPLENARIFFSCTGSYDPDSKIVQMVSEYTSDAIYAQYEAIMKSDVSEQMKQQKYYELFSQYGFLDVLEGIHYLSNTTQKRYAYLNLMTDASFCATSYQYWLDHTTKGHMARALLVADGLVFNNELNDWMSFKTYAESDYPGVAKYKEMLYDFMDATADKIMVENCVKSVKDVQKLAKNVNAAAKTYADDLIQKINHCETTDELQNLMASAEAKGVFVNLASSYDQDGNPEFSFKLDETTGFGKFAKAMKWSNKIMSLCTLGYDEIQDMISLNGRLEVYAQYRTFLTDIVNNTEYIPFQLRWAAQQILEEMEEGYSGIVKDIVIEILNQSDINSEVLKTIVGKTGAASLSAWLTTIQIESYFINKLADVGEMVKKEAYVEGYAYLASAFKTQLEKAKQAFLKNKTEKNAWNFYYNYNILYQLRYKGEEAYLAFSKINGLAGALYDFGYTDKKLVVDDTIKMLKERCQFVYDDEKDLPESCQFAAKAVIKCPVNVMVYDEAGTEIAVLRDGVESDITNAYGRFAVVYNAYAGDYQKVLCFANADSDYRIRIQGTDAGFVTMEMASKQTDDTVYAFRNIEMQKDGVIEASIHQMTQDNSYSIDTDGDGIADTVKPVEVISHQYVPVTAVTFDKSSVDMLVGDSVMMKPGVLPENASNQGLTWLSGNPEIVTVKDGKLYAVSAGQTSIYVIAQDNTDISAACVVTVSSKDTVLTGDDTKVPEKPALPGDATSSGAIQNPQGDSTSATQDADRITSLHITGMSHRIAAGKKIKLTLKGLPKYADVKCVKWSSSNPAYATVSAKGVVTTKKKGIGKTVTIRAAATDGSGSTASYKIQILKHAVRKLQLKTTAKTIKCGKKLKLKLRILTTGKKANTKLKWTSSNTRYATVTQKGVVTAKKAGKGKTVRITAMAKDGTGKKLNIKLKIQ